MSEVTEFDGKAKIGTPKGQEAFADPSNPIASEGHKTCASKGQPPAANARKPNSPAKAKGSLPQGPGNRADAGLPDSDGKATRPSPQGQGGAADPSLADIIAAIRAFHRERNFAMEQRKRVNLALGSYIRMALGWRKDMEEPARKKIAAAALLIIECGEALAKDKPHNLSDTEEFLRFRSTVMAAIASRQPWDAVEKDATKAMENLAKQLPVWNAWGKDIRGFGARSLAVIVGEAGDLSTYPKKGHLWKRMGVAVMGRGDGVADLRQGGLRKNANADDWIAHGYNAKRRAQMFVIGDVLVKMGEHYRQVYLARKEYERAKAAERGLTVAPAAKIPKKDAARFISDGHIHKRAQRYMEKRLLKNLWQAWRRLGQFVTADKARNDVPAASEIPRERQENGLKAKPPAPPVAADQGVPTAQPFDGKANLCAPSTDGANTLVPTRHPLEKEAADPSPRDDAADKVLPPSQPDTELLGGGLLSGAHKEGRTFAASAKQAKRERPMRKVVKR